jgi:hypothetical protein
VTVLRRLRKQQGVCSIFTGPLLHADHQPRSPQEWEQSLRTIRKAIAKRSTPDTAQPEPKEIWSVHLSEGCVESTPAVWNGRIYVGTRGGYD